LFSIKLSSMHNERMKGFRPYVLSLDRLLRSLIEEPRGREKHRCLTQSLNGQPAAVLRSSVPLPNRRADGVFFTGANLARRLLNHLTSELPPFGIIADVGCGAGDLLLACARNLPLGSDLNDTLQIWGHRLMGFDIYPEFIRATKTRLVLLAISRGATVDNSSVPAVNQVFPMIRQCDFLSNPEKVTTASHVIMNPPYNDLIAPSDCKWANGKVNAAALFLDTCLSRLPAGTTIAAILPDVLRSGSNYARWRHRIESLACRIEVTTCGQFDDSTDIHVFILRLEKASTPLSDRAVWWRTIKDTNPDNVGDHFEVHVGSVVPHRHREEGPSVAYIHAKSLPPWETVKRIKERRRFAGPLFEPPFVLVRRTSRPGEKRAIATIVGGRRKVAVENHLIALLPNTKTIAQCKQLLRVLKSTQTDRWLDNRIRCRHLTVQSIKDLPWWETDL